MEKKTLTVKYHAENKAEKTAYRLMKAHSGEYCVSGLEIQEGECTGPEISDEIEVLLKTEENLATESYRIEKINEQSFEISASDQLGLIYGVGRFLHRGHEEMQDEYCIPQRPVRGIYFATHFHNFYQDAPIEKVEEYMEELVLWGCNSISTWFDMHHFYGQEDPGAQDLLYRLKRIYRKAQEIGLKTSLNMLANEYYYGGPKELLAENSTEGTGYFLKMNGFYYTELCPSKPEAEAMILDARRRILTYFEDTKLDYIMLWPYDQGGCTCADCRPWGANGFLKLSKKLAEEVRSIFPETECILSLWRFDSFTHGEWDALFENLEDISSTYDYLMVDFDSPTTPHNLQERLKGYHLPTIGFPEISMLATPWGGFGAAPAPAFVERLVRVSEKDSAGGFAYSEGIFEDINKVLLLGLYFGNSTAEELLRDYFGYYFSRETGEYAQELCMGLEKTLPRSRVEADGKVNNYPTADCVDILPKFRIKDPELTGQNMKAVAEMEKTVSAEVSESDRFQMIVQRVQIDRALAENEGAHSYEVEKAAEKLEEIYHAAGADYVVCPITEKAIRENR